MEKCVGNNYMTLTNIFDQQTRQQTLVFFEEIQFDLSQNYCYDKIEDCLYFFRSVSTMATKQLEISQMFTIDEKRLQSRLGIDVY
jgi:aminopeptidase C